MKRVRLLRLRRLWCRIDGCRYTAVWKKWHRERFGQRVMPERASRAEWVTGGILADLQDGYVACMTCGVVRDSFHAAPGTCMWHPDYPTWTPPFLRYGRHQSTCHLCLLRGWCPWMAACSECGVTDYELYQARLR